MQGEGGAEVIKSVASLQLLMESLVALAKCVDPEEDVDGLPSELLPAIACAKRMCNAHEYEFFETDYIALAVYRLCKTYI